MAEDNLSSSSSLVLGVRLIRSFQHRNIRRIVLKVSQEDLQGWTTQDLKRILDQKIPSESSLPPPFKKYAFDTFKIEHLAHKAKTSDPVINRENDQELILKEDVSLAESGVQHETELSYFKLEDYEAYKVDPKLAW